MNVARYGIGGMTGAAVAACLLIACPPASADEKTVLQLRWDHQFQFAGYYAALWQGYYREAGLDVEIRSAFEPDGRFHSVTREVSEGRADFGTGAADILVARDKGAPLMVLASVYQRSPVAFYARAELGLASPADLTRLRVATLGGSGFASVELQAMLRAENIDPALVPQQRIQGRLGLHDLAKGVADVATGFTISADWVARNLGLRLTSLRPAAYGVDFYGEALFSHRRLIDDDPGMVQRFVAASLKGWEYALTHPEQIADRIARELPRKVPIEDLTGFNRFQIEPVRKLIQYPIVELGHTNPNRWGWMHEALHDAGVITGPYSSDDLIFDAERMERQRFERIGRIVLVFLGVIVVVAIAGWVWTLRRSLAERVGAEAALREEEKRFRDFAVSASDWFWETDAEARLSYVSDHVRKVLGWEPQDFLGRIANEVVEPEVAENSAQPGLESDERQPFHDLIYAIRDREGNPRTIRTGGIPVHDRDGVFLGYRGTATDITEINRAENALRESEDKYRNLVEESIQAMIIYQDDHIVFANRATAMLSGYSIEELIGKSVNDLISPDDIEWLLERRAARERGEEDSSRVQFRGLIKDGSVRWMEGFIQTVEWEGRPAHLSIAVDITERKRAEETLRESKQRFQAFAESTADWFWEMDANLRYVYVSPNVESIVGHAPEWYYGKTHEELLGEDYDHEVWDGLLQALREHRPFRDYVFRRDERWANPGWTNVSGAPVFAADGSFLGFRGSSSDITEQQRAEEAVRVRDGRLRELQAELLHASRLSEMGQFSSALAHELSQPLTAIMNYLQACRRLLDAEDAAGPETTRELMQKAFDQALRASDVIRSLRGFVEKKEAERAALEINQVVEEAATLGRIGSSKAKLHVELDLGNDLPPVLIDKIQIQQVVLNLVRNGIEAMAESARRELTIKSARTAEDWIEVSVGDTGAGLSEEVAEQLFQPFVTTKAEGMGIGLSISHSIVAAHGGRLWATPNPVGGTVFHFTVPVAPKGDGGDVP